jgi:hypothetical protein
MAAVGRRIGDIAMVCRRVMPAFICDQVVETMDHIILGCVFNREVWASCLRRFLLHDLVVVEQVDIMLWWTSSRPKEIRHGFDSLFLLIGWLLWKERNARTFNRIAAFPVQLLESIEQEVSMWCAAGYKRLGALESRRH